MRRMGQVLFAIAVFLFAQVAQAAWTPAKRLTWTSGNSTLGAVVVDGSDYLHVVWTDSTPGKGEIYYKKSTDQGATWLASQRLTWSPDWSADPAIAVDSLAQVHVVWQDITPGNAEIYYKKSTDGGATWQPSQRLTWNTGGSYGPAIGTDGSNNVHLVWSDATPGNCEVYYKKSTDGGATWTPAQRLTWSAEWSGNLALAVQFSGELHAVWYDYTPGNAEVYYKKSTDAGDSWSTSQRLTWNSGSSYWPAIAVDFLGALHVAWPDETPGNWEVYYKKSADGGAAWTASQRLTWTSGDSYTTAIAIDHVGDYHVVLADDTTGYREVYYKRSTDGGTSWTTSQRLTWNPGDSSGPVMAIDSSNTIHVLWEDYAHGNSEIYYLSGK